MMKQATLKIDLDTILYNCKHLKCYYKKKMMAVLKDDAYGLGLLEIANHIKDEVDMVLVSKIEEIKLLKENAFNKDILYLNVFDKEDIEILKRYQVHVIVDNLSQLEIAKEYNLPFHLKINCGMNRLGLYKKDIEIAIKKINKGKYNIKGVMAHFQDEDKHHESYVRFKKYVEKIKIDNLMIHCHASNSLSTYYENITTHIRVGIKLYGLGEKNCFLHNALTLTSPILRINNVDKGEYVGYDKTYCCKEKGYLYILPIGYGNGMYKTNNSIVYVDNTFLKQAGKISMDYATYFSTKLIKSDEIIEIFGKKVPLESLAYQNKCSLHEMIVNLKVNKQYIKEKKQDE